MTSAFELGLYSLFGEKLDLLVKLRPGERVTWKGAAPSGGRRFHGAKRPDPGEQ